MNKNTKQQQANKIRPYKYPRFGKYVLHKLQGHSRQHNCFVFSLKKSRLLNFLFYGAVSSISD